MQEILAIEQNQQGSDEERTRHVDHEGCERKGPVVSFIDRKRDEITSQRTHRPTAENQETAQEQMTILACNRAIGAERGAAKLLNSRFKRLPSARFAV